MSAQLFPSVSSIPGSPVLEEVLQGLADGVPLLDGQQMFQLLPKGAAMHADTGGQNICDPLKGAEDRRTGTFWGNATPYQVLVSQTKRRGTFLHYQSGHGTTALQHGYHLLMGGGPGNKCK